MQELNSAWSFTVQYCVQLDLTIQWPVGQQDEMFLTAGGAEMPQTRPDMPVVLKLQMVVGRHERQAAIVGGGFLGDCRAMEGCCLVVRRL
jgi:hypothetical protein